MGGGEERSRGGRDMRKMGTCWEMRDREREREFIERGEDVID